MNSCIYRGSVRHHRTEPVEHDFRYPLFMMYLDLDELPELFRGRWLWSADRPAPAWFRRADYLGSPDVPLSQAVRDEAERLTGARPSGPIRVLTHLRYFGYIQNPVSFYYCFEPEADRVETILAEITNTPWGERHTYALTGDRERAVCTTPHEFEKSFHISPFMDMGQRYEWQFTEPGDQLFVHMKSHAPTGKIFDATLRVERQEISGGALNAALLRYPWMTLRVLAGIYWQALRLRLKGAPYHDHPDRVAA